MIIDNHFHRIISNFGYRLRALRETVFCDKPKKRMFAFHDIAKECEFNG